MSAIDFCFSPTAALGVRLHRLVRFWPSLGADCSITSASRLSSSALSPPAPARLWRGFLLELLLGMRFRLLRRLFIRARQMLGLGLVVGRLAVELLLVFGLRGVESGLFIKRELLLRRFGRLLLFRRRRLFAFCSGGGAPRLFAVPAAARR